MVSEFLQLEVESKKAITKFFADLKSIAERSYEKEVAHIKSQICLLLEKLNAESSFPLEYDAERDMTEIFKAFGVKISWETSSLLERLVAYIQVQARYLSVKHFFFVGLKCVLSQKEILQLYREAQLEQVSLFLLENVQKDPLKGEITRILDRDLCEILVNS